MAFLNLQGLTTFLNNLKTNFVQSFNGRKGTVTPTKGDYSIDKISPTSGATEGQVPVLVNNGTEQEPDLEFEMQNIPGGGDTVSWTQIQATGTKIAEIDINGTSQDIYSPTGGGSTVTYTQTLSSGTKTGSISIDGVSTDMYAPTQPTKVSDLQNDSGFIDNTVNNLTNYYLKSETYTQAEVNALIGAITTLNILVVQTLPTQDISTTTIYLVPKTTAQTDNVYDEYIYVNNAWELIGTTQIDLSNYYTKSETDTLLNAKVSDNPTFTEASTRANIASGETFATILGKIKKFFSDLKTVAFTGSYTDLSDKPTIPTVNNATLTIQKNGTTVKTFTANASSNVTANITVPTKTSDLTNDSFATVATSGSYNDLSNKPTIPTVNNATLTIQRNGTTVNTFTANASSNVTADIAVPNGAIYYGTCNSQAANQKKAVTVAAAQNFSLTTGAVLYVKFDADNTYSATAEAPVQLNVNSGTDVTVYGANTAAVTGTNTTYFGRKNYINCYMYDGTYWVWQGSSADNNSDTKVTQTVTTTNANYEVLFSQTADNTTRTEAARKNSNLKFNPSTGNLQATQLNGVTIGSSPKFTDTTYTFATGDSNGQIKVTPNGGTAQNVSVKGLGTAAYTASTAYATSTLLTNQDLNTVKTPGFYNAAGGNTVTNKPSGIDYFGLEVIHNASGDYYTQIIGNGTTFYRRSCSGDTSSWTAWTQDKYTDNNTWTAMVGATSSANGSVGYVNAVPPKDGYNTKYLRADGSWQVPPDNDTKKVFFGTCTGQAANQKKAVTISSDQNFTLTTGAIIFVKFDANNTYSATAEAPVQLNVNSSGDKTIYGVGGSAITGTNTTFFGRTNYINQYVYDGTYWVWTGSSADNNTTYTPQALGIGYGTCTTAAATAAKAATLSNYALVTNGTVAIKFTNAVPANATLAINGKTAKNIYYRGAAITAGIINAGDTATFFYNGSQYHVIAVDNVEKPTFTEATTRANIASGETFTTILGKIKKFFTDLKDLAFIAIDSASSTKYLRGDGTWQAFPTIPAAQVNSDWNASSGVAKILNKPTLGTAAATASTDYMKENGFAANNSSYTTLNNGTYTVTPNNMISEVLTLTTNNGFSTYGTFRKGEKNGYPIYEYFDVFGNYAIRNTQSGTWIIYYSTNSSHVIHLNSAGTSSSGSVIVEHEDTASDANRREMIAYGNGNGAPWFMTIQYAHTYVRAVVSCQDRDRGVKFIDATHFAITSGAWDGITVGASFSNFSVSTASEYKGIDASYTNYPCASDVSAISKYPNGGNDPTACPVFIHGKDSNYRPGIGFYQPNGAYSCIFYMGADGSLYARWNDGTERRIIGHSDGISYATGDDYGNNIRACYASSLELTAYGSLSFNYVLKNKNGAALSNGSVTLNTSSRRFKENIAPLTEEEAKKILDVEAVTFDYTKDYDNYTSRKGYKNIGCIAEDVNEIIPELVTEDQDGEIFGINYLEMVPYLLKVVQMQQTEIDGLKDELSSLRKSLLNSEE